MHPHQKQILCVDDEENTCTLLSSLLGFINYHVTAVGTVPQALDKIINEHFDLYILELWLPGGSGVDLCRKIRETDKQTPVIFYSAAAYDSERQEALAAGAQAYLIKPTDLSKVIEMVNHLLGVQ